MASDCNQLHSADTVRFGYDIVISYSKAQQGFVDILQRIFNRLERSIGFACDISSYCHDSSSSTNYERLLQDTPASSSATGFIPIDNSFRDAARSCHVAVVVVSDEYALSMHCMLELKFLIANSGRSIIQPIFYNLNSEILTHNLEDLSKISAMRRLAKFINLHPSEDELANFADKVVSTICNVLIQQYVEIQLIYDKLYERAGGSGRSYKLDRDSRLHLITGLLLSIELKKLDVMLHRNHDLLAYRKPKQRQSNHDLKKSDKVEVGSDSLDLAVDLISLKVRYHFLLCRPLRAPARPQSATVQLIQKGCARGNIDVSVQVFWNLLPCENVEFFFSNEKEMASCVGVGLPHSVVVLNADLSIFVYQMKNQREWDLFHDLRAQFLNEESSRLVMEWKQSTEEEVDVIVDAFASAPEMSETYGVGFDGIHRLQSHSKNCKVKPQASRNDKSIVPLLYEVALLVTTHTIHKKCSNESCGGSNSVKVSGGQGTLNHKLSERCNKRQGNGDDDDNDDEQKTGDGDGNKDRSEFVKIAEKGVDSAEVLTVIVFPLTKYSFRVGEFREERCWEGLERASIGAELVFEFRRYSAMDRQLSIEATSTLELCTKYEVREDGNKFGWCHDGIEIALGVEHDNPMSRLKANSRRLSGGPPARSCTLSTMDGTDKSSGSTSSMGAEADLHLAKLHIGKSTDTHASATRSETLDQTYETMYNGFIPKDLSGIACVKFGLNHQVKVTDSVWHSNKASFHQSLGLCSTIDPCIGGTWQCLDKSPASPYMLAIARRMALYERTTDNCTTHVCASCDQEYTLLFLVNHAMTHIRRQEGQTILLVSEAHERDPEVKDTMNMRHMFN